MMVLRPSTDLCRNHQFVLAPLTYVRRCLSATWPCGSVGHLDMRSYSCPYPYPCLQVWLILS